MQNRGGIIFLAVTIAALCLFYLSFTVISRKVQSDADEFARDTNGVVDYFKKQDYIDSLWNEQVYLGFTYKEVKDYELSLGLDLQGGMAVVLEVSPVEILRALSGNSKNESFEEALQYASKEQAQSQANFTTLFFDRFKELAPSTPLTEIFANSANQDRIDFNSSDDQVIEMVEGEVNDAVDRAFEIIKTRIDKFGVTQPNVQRIQGTGRIQVELPGVDNPARIRKLLQGVAKLEFLEVYTPQEAAPYLQRMNDLLVKRENALNKLEESTDELVAETLTDQDQTEEESDDLFAGGDDEAAADSTAADSTEVAQQDPMANLSAFYRLMQPQYGGMVYEVADTSEVNTVLADREALEVLPADMKFFWAAKPAVNEGGKSYVQLHIIKKLRKAPLSGDVVVDARPSFDQFGRPAISMNMNVKGAKDWKKLTGKNLGRPVAIVLDNLVYTAPTVQSEIDGGRSEITGDFTIEESKDLANILKAGKLPAPTRIVEEVVVGPSLGLEAQTQGLTSIVIGLVLVVVFMIAYYAQGGMVANLALLLNIFFIFGVLAQFNAALTLPGIAGIVLTIGMSIDANVLIFERIREELKKEIPIMEAIKLGYERAFWTIFDSNLTTFLTAIFLFILGSGPIKGFATTLMVGIACSFFTAVYVTRVFVTYMTKKGNESKISFVTPLSKSLLRDFNFDFLGKRKVAYAISASLIVIGWGLIFAQGGLNLGVDFKGGRSYIVGFNESIVPSDLQVALTDKVEGKSVEVKTYGNANTLKVTTAYLIDDESTETDNKVLDVVKSGIAEFTGKTYVENVELMNDGTFHIPSTSKVGATIADDIENASWKAGLFSLLALFMYIWVRFRRWKFGLGAIVALFHDSLLVFGFFGIAGAIGISFEIDQVFVAALLTVIGYSINDTVVVFDRVREYLRLGTDKTLKATLNHSVNSTLNRTLMTSVTTLLVVLILLLFGGEVLRGFSYALLVGVLFGTYSSMFVATPIVYDTSSGELEEPAEEAVAA